MEKCHSGVYDAMETFMNNFAAEGYSATQLLYQLHERIVFADDITAKQKIVIGEKMAVLILNIFQLILSLLTLIKFLQICDHRLSDGADEHLQLLDLCCTIMNSFNE